MEEGMGSTRGDHSIKAKRRMRRYKSSHRNANKEKQFRSENEYDDLDGE